MPFKKVPCPKCGGLKSKVAVVCINCREPYERTPEHRKNLSEKLKGRPPRGYGWKHTESTKKKMKAIWTKNKRAEARKRGKAFAESMDWLRTIALSVSGEKNGNYQGKNQRSQYGPGWGRVYKQKMRARARGICEWCGEKKESLDLHHKDFKKSNHHPDNLAVICRSCHKKAHGEHKRSLRQSSRLASPSKCRRVRRS